MMPSDQRQPKMTRFEMSDADFEMFVKFPHWMIYTDFKPDTRCVYLALWSHARGDVDGSVVWPSVARIAWLVNIGSTRAKEAIKELQEAGLVFVKGRRDNGGGANQYLLYEPSWKEIEALTNRRNQKPLTSDDTKTQGSDQAWSPRDHGWSPRGEGSPSGGEGVAATRPRSRSKKEIQEPEPLTRATGPASGGTNPEGMSRRPLRGLETTDTTSGPVSQTNQIPAHDFSVLRARLERHT